MRGWRTSYGDGVERTMGWSGGLDGELKDWMEI